MSTPAEETCVVRPGEELDVPRLTAFLRDHIATFSGKLEVLQFPHGHSNLTYLLRSGSEEWVLRRPPFGNQVKSAHDMGREYRVLSGLSLIFSPAPRPLVYCEDESVLGAPFYVMERRRGLILRREWPPELPRNPELLRQMCGSLIDALADLHEINPRDAGLADFGKPEGYVQRQIEGWTKRYRAAQTDQVPEMEAVAEWLAARMPAESGASLIHNDFKFDNVAFDPHIPQQISTIFDWEMATIGDPLMDLGTTLGYWVEASEIEQLSASFVGPTWLPGADAQGIGGSIRRTTRPGVLRHALLLRVWAIQDRGDRPADLREIRADRRAIRGSRRSIPASAKWPGKPRARLRSECLGRKSFKADARVLLAFSWEPHKQANHRLCRKHSPALWAGRNGLQVSRVSLTLDRRPETGRLCILQSPNHPFRKERTTGGNTLE